MNPDIIGNQNICEINRIYGNTRMYECVDFCLQEYYKRNSLLNEYY